MTFTAILFLASAGAIYLACEFFVNGVEWLGKRLNVATTSTGTVLADFGIALPASAVTLRLDEARKGLCPIRAARRSGGLSCSVNSAGWTRVCRW
jgi:hypothetical protein